MSARVREGSRALRPVSLRKDKLSGSLDVEESRLRNGRQGTKEEQPKDAQELPKETSSGSCRLTITYNTSFLLQPAIACPWW